VDGAAVSPWLPVAVVALLLAAIQTARLVWSRTARAWAIRARARRAVEGEHRAEPLLRRAGYEVLGTQVPGRWTVFADGEPLEIGLRADLLVARGDRTYIAEVKTGRLAPRLDHAATRRQLLEYRMAFGVDGVLLVDAEKGSVVAFEAAQASEPRARAARSPMFVFVAGAIAGGLAVWLTLAYGVS
jgi:hypothetical protein